MPNCVTHYLHAKQVLQQMPEDINRQLNRNAYFWAAQGPDFLFCHRHLPWMKGESLREHGSKIHKALPSELFNALRVYINTHPNNNLSKSYVLGFVNHYTLDSIAHPYINALAAELLPDFPDQDMTALHADIESSLDTILLRKNTGKLPSQVRLKAFFPKDKQVQQEIAEIYSHLIFKLYNDTVKEIDLYRATQDARIVFSLLTDTTTLKRKIVRNLEAGKPKHMSGHILPLVESAEIDYANVSCAPWYYENGQSSTKSFFDLFDEAVSKALQIIVQFEACDFADMTGEVPMG